MLKYLVLSRKNIALCLGVFIILTYIFGEFYYAGNMIKNGKTEALRREFINSCGYDVSDMPTVKRTILQAEFPKEYEKSKVKNSALKFDLKDYAGKEVDLYCYPCCDYQKTFYLFVYNNRIIGGSVDEL